jgi:cytochrome c oxidase cbb3-type subunit 3
VARLFPRMAIACTLIVSAGCSKEARTLGPDLPVTPPNGPADPRAAKYEKNVYQVAQGGRYFTWYGCASCHGSEADGAANLSDRSSIHGTTFDQTYAFIADGHGRKLWTDNKRIPAEQLWQLTAYSRSLPQLALERRRRQDLDQIGEPQGSVWAGAVK